MGSGDNLWNQVRVKVDRVAEAVAMMEEGLFEFKDGKPKWTTEDGMRVPRVVKKEAMVHGGYNAISQTVFTNIFNSDGAWHSYFLERLRWHRMRLSGGFKKSLAEITDGGTALTELSTIAWKVLMEQLQDPEAAKKMKPDTVARIYLDSTKLDANLRGEADTRHKTPQAGPSVMNVINLPDGYKPKGGDVIEGELDDTAS